MTYTVQTMNVEGPVPGHVFREVPLAEVETARTTLREARPAGACEWVMVTAED